MKSRSYSNSSSSALSISSTVRLTRFLMSLRSDPLPTATMFADTSRPPSSMICCLAAGNHIEGRGTCSAMRCLFANEITHHAVLTVFLIHLIKSARAF